MSGHSRSDEMTLAFELSAFQRLVDPAAAVEDAGSWSAHVGIIDNDEEAIRTALAKHGLDQDFDLAGRDKWLALQEIRAETATPRHVYIGESEDGRRAAAQTGWEFLPIKEAAQKAGWELSSDDEEDEAIDPGLLDRLRSLLSSD